MAARRIGLRARGRLPAGTCYAYWRPAERFLDDCELHESLVEASSRAFGRNMRPVWRERFEGGFLDALDRFYLVLASTDQTALGWTCYRATTIRRQRCIYFDSTGLVPEYQGRHVMPTLQRKAMLGEMARHPLQPIRMILRTRSPIVYRGLHKTFRGVLIPRPDGSVPKREQPLMADIARWLGQEPFDPATGVVRDAYRERGPVYGRSQEPRSASAEIDELFDRLPVADALLLVGRITALRLLAAGLRLRR